MVLGPKKNHGKCVSLCMSGSVAGIARKVGQDQGAVPGRGHEHHEVEDLGLSAMRGLNNTSGSYFSGYDYGCLFGRWPWHGIR